MEGLCATFAGPWETMSKKIRPPGQTTAESGDKTKTPRNEAFRAGCFH
jgi:hypothetical protein